MHDIIGLRPGRAAGKAFFDDALAFDDQFELAPLFDVQQDERRVELPRQRGPIFHRRTRRVAEVDRHENAFEQDHGA